MANALASLLGTTSEEAGFILGFALIVVLMVSILLVLDKAELNVGLIVAGVGVAFAALVGWWPLWTVIFVALLVVLVIVNPFGEGSGA